MTGFGKPVYRPNGLAILVGACLWLAIVAVVIATLTF